MKQHLSHTKWESNILKNSEKLKILVRVNGPLLAIFDQLSSCWPSLMSTNNDRHLKQKLNTPKFGSVFKLKMWQPLPEFKNTVAMALPLKRETRN